MARSGISRNSAPKSPHLSSTASPLLSAFQTPGELLSRSIPFPGFLSSSTPSTGPPNSLGSASGGIGLGVGGASPPPSAPASYNSGGNFGAARQVRGYPGFEEQYSSYHGHGGYYNPTQRYAQGSPSPLNAQFGAAATVNTLLQPGEGNFACTFDTLDEPAFGGANGGFMGLAVSGGNGNGGGENVVCLGWEGGVDIWRVGRGVVEQVGRLEGLGGGVKGAKVTTLCPFFTIFIFLLHYPYSVILVPRFDSISGLGCLIGSSYQSHSKSHFVSGMLNILLKASIGY